MFKIPKLIIKIILSIVVSILVFVFSVLFFLYKSHTPPTFVSKDFDFEEEISKELTRVLDNRTYDKTFRLKFDEELINNYLNDALEDFNDTKDEVEQGTLGIVRIQGVWFKLNGDYIDLEFSTYIVYKTIVYKTGANIRFKIEGIDDGVLKIKLEKVKIGKISLKWLVRIAPSVARIFSGEDFDVLMDELLGGLGTFSQRDMTVSINLKDLVDTNLEEEDASLLVDIILSNNLVNVEVDESINFVVYFEELIDDSKVDTLAENLKIKDEDDLATILTNKAVIGLIGSNEEITFNELDVNRLFSYAFSDMDTEGDMLFDFEFYNDLMMTVYYPYFKIENNRMIINFPIRIGDEINYIESILRADVVINKRNDDLVLTLHKVLIHNVTIERNQLSFLLDNIENEFFNNGDIIFENFFEDFSDDNFNVRSVLVINNKLVFKLHTTVSFDFLNELKDLIDNEELVRKLEEISEKVFNDLEITEDIINDLEDIVDSLTEEEIDDLLDKIQDLFGDYFPFS